MYKKIYNAFHSHYHRRYHGIYAHAKQLFVFDLFLLGLAIVMLGTAAWFFFWKPSITDLINLSVSIGDSRIKSGEEIRVTIDYTNHSKLTLRHPTLSVKLPPGFVVNRTRTPESYFSSNHTFTITSDIPPNAGGQQEIYGRLWVDAGATERIIAALSYTTDDNQTAEQKYASYYAHLSDSVIKATISSPTSSFPQKTLPLTITLTNTDGTTPANVSLKASWPLPIPLLEQIKNIPLAGGETKTITTTFSLPATPNIYDLSVAPIILANNHAITLSPASQKIAVVAPSVPSSISLVENPLYVEPGATIPVTVRWNNASNFTLTKAKLRLSPTPGTVNLKKTALENNLKVDGDTLVVDASNRTALTSVTAGSSDSFTVSVSFLPRFTISADIPTSSWHLTPVFEAEIPEVPGQIFTQTGAGVRLPLATELSWTSATRYYTDEGDQLGRGPLPPVVGETTKYWVSVEIYNTVNPVSNAHFEATLPPGVSFTGRQSVTIGPNIALDSANNKVVWNFRELPAYSQTGLYFELSVTPNPSQLGKSLSILNSLTFTADDDLVNKKITLTKPQITNVLPSSDQGAALGATVISK